ncbi:hypothetical protein Zmor_024268 [Zophobas morio]|uniref:PHD-type domain-containing protein n=1 Tax=Zophobas morio TaxID=2755281 RepID=A0AA38I2R1_9CUCU|nr:hypothetical protein Zmor_024268 [Zophobas morio]
MTCVICKKKVSRSADCVTCDLCRGAVHTECADLSRAEIECIRSKSRKIHFYCANCDIVATINNLKEELAGVKSELNELKNSQGKVIHQDSVKKLSDDDILMEIEDRNHRAANLVLFNLPESSEMNSSERKNDDMFRCRKIVIPENKNNVVNSQNCIRLGKFDNDKVRPVKIIFENPHQAIDALRTYKRSDNLYLNRDLTPRQQNYNFVIRTEFKNRLEKGEDNIFLKYVNGIPKIVPKKNLKNMQIPNSQ